MDPRSDRTSVVRSRLMNILSLRMQAPSSSPSATLNTLNSNAPPSLLPSTDEPVKGTPGDASPSLPQIPPIRSGSLEPLDAPRRTLTPITEGGSGSERDPSRPVISGASVDSSSQQPTSPTSAPNEDLGEKQALEAPISTSPAQSSPSSAYAPTEATSVPVSPPQGRSREVSRDASVAKLSLGTTTPFTGSVSNEEPFVDDNQAPDIRVASPTSVHSLHSSAASPPSLSPANSSDLRGSVSPVQVAPRTPSPGFSILTSPHSPSPLVGQSFVELGSSGDRSPLSLQSTTPPAALPAAVSPPPKDPTQTNKDTPREEAHGISEEAGALYYIHELDQDSVGTDLQPPESDNKELSSETDSEIPQPPWFIQPTAPLRPKGASPPPQPTSPRSLPRVDTSQHRKPPSQPIPRTPTLDYGPDRRPAGARAAPGSNRQETSTWGAQPPRNLSIRSDRKTQPGNMSHSEDPDADALAALTFLERHEDAPPDVPVSSYPQAASPPPPWRPQPPPAIVEPEMGPPSTENENNTSTYRSSFAPSKNAMQRKAKTEAQQAAHEAATHRPGRGSGRTKNRHKASGAWGDSSEEEEEEEEEEDDEDVDSDGQPSAPRDDRSVSNYAPSVNQRSQYSSPRGPSPLPIGDAPSNQAHPRPPRNLPPVPTLRGQSTSLVLPIRCV
jgi:CCR4-NOT transcriptional complex subunit CAF120